MPTPSAAPPAGALARFLATAGVLAAIAAPPLRADLDVAFVLDTTGSMSGEIREVRERVREIATSLGRSRSGERLRFGLVAYRDRGDAYVTLVSPLSEDVAIAAAFLDALQADGGGDGPEAVVAALAAALRELDWDLAPGTDRQLFLIGDAPPHLDYSDDPRPEDLLAEARRDRIVVHAIGCRSLPPPGVAFFRRVAYATEGSYQHIGRVSAATGGGLAAALDRTAAAGVSERPPTGDPLAVSWLEHREEEVAGILVRQSGPRDRAPSQQGEALRPCSIEVLLPGGLALAGEPRVRLGPRGLRVDLELQAGAGGRDLFTLGSCPPLPTPVHVFVKES